jgi:hypothetical protein
MAAVASVGGVGGTGGDDVSFRLEAGGEWSKVGVQLRRVLERSKQQAIETRIGRRSARNQEDPHSPNRLKEEGNLPSPSSSLLPLLNALFCHSPLVILLFALFFLLDMHLFGITPTEDPLLLVTCGNCSKTIKASHFAAHLGLFFSTSSLPDFASFSITITFTIIFTFTSFSRFSFSSRSNVYSSMSKNGTS